PRTLGGRPWSLSIYSQQSPGSAVGTGRALPHVQGVENAVRVVSADQVHSRRGDEGIRLLPPPVVCLDVSLHVEPVFAEDAASPIETQLRDEAASGRPVLTLTAPRHPELCG